MLMMTLSRSWSAKGNNPTVTKCVAMFVNDAQNRRVLIREENLRENKPVTFLARLEGS